MEARAGPLAVNTPRLDFAEVRQKRGQDLIGATHQAAGAQVELAIGDMIEAVGGGLSLSFHASSLHPEISALCWARSLLFSGRTSLRSSSLRTGPPAPLTGPQRGLTGTRPRSRRCCSPSLSIQFVLGMIIIDREWDVASTRATFRRWAWYTKRPCGGAVRGVSGLCRGALRYESP